MAKRRRVAREQHEPQQQALDLGDVAVAPSLQPGAYRTYEPPVDLAHAAQQPPGNLRLEIAAVRAVLADLLKMNLAPDLRARTIGNLTAALVRLVRENRYADGNQSDQFEQTLSELLQDRNVGLAASAAARSEGGEDGSNDR